MEFLIAYLLYRILKKMYEPKPQAQEPPVDLVEVKRTLWNLRKEEARLRKALNR